MCSKVVDEETNSLPKWYKAFLGNMQFCLAKLIGEVASDKLKEESARVHEGKVSLQHP